MAFLLSLRVVRVLQLFGKAPVVGEENR